MRSLSQPSRVKEGSCESSPVPMTVDVPITYTTADGDVVHAPMVEAVVSGVATKLVVDTGASDHVLTMELARRIGLHLEAGEPGTDVTGAKVSSWYASGDVPVSLPGGAGGPVDVLRDVVVIDGPPPFARWGIGGIVSPQRLHPSGAVVLDLDRDVLTIGDTADVPAGSWIAADVQRHHGGVLCVDAAVAPFSPCSMFLDSGAGDTDVDRTAVPGAVDDVLSSPLLVVAGVAFPLVALNVSDGIPRPEGSTDDEAPHGLIGMDVMKGTVLVIPPADGGRQVQWLMRSPASDGSS